MTQRETLEAALVRHGCIQVKVSAKGSQWTQGDLTNRPNDTARPMFFFVGNSGGFRFGTSRSNSAAWEKTRARLLAERPFVLPGTI